MARCDAYSEIGTIRAESTLHWFQLKRFNARSRLCLLSTIQQRQKATNCLVTFYAPIPVRIGHAGQRRLRSVFDVAECVSIRSWGYFSEECGKEFLVRVILYTCIVVLGWHNLVRNLGPRMVICWSVYFSTISRSSDRYNNMVNW